MDDQKDCAGYKIGSFVLTDKPLRLTCDGQEVQLRIQALLLLKLLVENTGVLVSQEDIRKRLWGERHVDHKRGIHLLIGEIRHTLGDSADCPSYIQTLPRQGYRLIAETQRNVGMADPSNGLFAKTRAVPKPKVFAGIALSILAVAGLTIFSTNLLRPDRIDGEPSPARDAYLKGAYLIEQDRIANLDKSANYFAHALLLDSKYAPAHAGLAEIALFSGDFDVAEAHARNALMADPEHASAYLHLGLVAAQRDWNWSEAERLTRRAISLDPHSAKAQGALASLLIILNRPAEALVVTGQAEKLDSVSALLKTDIGWIQYYAGDYQSAEQTCAEAHNLAPDTGAGAHCQYKVALMLGDVESASKSAASLVEYWLGDDDLVQRLRDKPSAGSLVAFDEYRRLRISALLEIQTVPAEYLAVAYAEMGDHETAARMLKLAADGRGRNLPLLLRDPVFVPLHDDTRFLYAINEAGIG